MLGNVVGFPGGQVEGGFFAAEPPGKPESCIDYT